MQFEINTCHEQIWHQTLIARHQKVPLHSDTFKRLFFQNSRIDFVNGLLIEAPEDQVYPACLLPILDYCLHDWHIFRQTALSHVHRDR